LMSSASWMPLSSNAVVNTPCGNNNHHRRLEDLVMSKYSKSYKQAKQIVQQATLNLFDTPSSTATIMSIETASALEEECHRIVHYQQRQQQHQHVILDQSDGESIVSTPAATPAVEQSSCIVPIPSGGISAPSNPPPQPTLLITTTTNAAGEQVLLVKVQQPPPTHSGTTNANSSSTPKSFSVSLDPHSFGTPIAVPVNTTHPTGPPRPIETTKSALVHSPNHHCHDNDPRTIPTALVYRRASTTSVPVARANSPSKIRWSDDLDATTEHRSTEFTTTSGRLQKSGKPSRTASPSKLRSSSPSKSLSKIMESSTSKKGAAKSVGTESSKKKISSRSTVEVSQTVHGSSTTIKSSHRSSSPLKESAVPRSKTPSKRAFRSIATENTDQTKRSQSPSKSAANKEPSLRSSCTTGQSTASRTTGQSTPTRSASPSKSKSNASENVKALFKSKQSRDATSPSKRKSDEKEIRDVPQRTSSKSSKSSVHHNDGFGECTAHHNNSFRHLSPGKRSSISDASSPSNSKRAERTTTAVLGWDDILQQTKPKTSTKNSKSCSNIDWTVDGGTNNSSDSAKLKRHHSTNSKSTLTTVSGTSSSTATDIAAATTMTPRSKSPLRRFSRSSSRFLTEAAALEGVEGQNSSTGSPCSVMDSNQFQEWNKEPTTKTRYATVVTRKKSPLRRRRPQLGDSAASLDFADFEALTWQNLDVAASNSFGASKAHKSSLLDKDMDALFESFESSQSRVPQHFTSGSVQTSSRPSDLSNHKQLDNIFAANGSTRNLNKPHRTSSSVSTKSKKSLGSLFGTVPNNDLDSHGGGGGASVQSSGSKQAMIPVVQRVRSAAKGNGTPVKPATSRRLPTDFFTSNDPFVVTTTGTESKLVESEWDVDTFYAPDHELFPNCNKLSSDIIKAASLQGTGNKTAKGSGDVVEAKTYRASCVDSANGFPPVPSGWTKTTFLRRANSLDSCSGSSGDEGGSGQRRRRRVVKARRATKIKTEKPFKSTASQTRSSSSRLW
jgi:hypothetical protein